jgi:hypothetical protein
VSPVTNVSSRPETALMRAKDILSALAVAAAVLAARPAAAQHAAEHAVAAVAASAAPQLRVLATYDVSAGRRGPGTPARVTVADSGGVLVGSLWLVGDDAAHPVAVSVHGTDLVLTGRTPRGPMELVLYRQNERMSSQIAGRWTIGTTRGPLRGAQRG